MTVATNLKQLYEIDDHLWLLETIELLKQKKLTELDIENLIEELESLARRDQHKVKGLLEQVIRHLLLLQYWAVEYERNHRHWQGELLSFRNQLEDRLTTNLRNYLIAEMDIIYQRALQQVQIKTDFQVNFPEECPYTFEQLLDIKYLP